MRIARPLLFGLDRLDLPDAVDVALDVVAAERLAGPGRRLEVDLVTGAPAAPSVVRLIVSGTAVTANCPSATSVAVRQQPSIETESPTESWEAVAGASIRRCVRRRHFEPRASLPDDPGEHAEGYIARPRDSARHAIPRYAHASQGSLREPASLGLRGQRPVRAASSRRPPSWSLDVGELLRGEPEPVVGRRLRARGHRPSGGHPVPTGRALNRVDRHRPGRAATSARPFSAQLRRDEEQQLVDETGAEERAGERRPALEQERLHVLAGQAG